LDQEQIPYRCSSIAVVLVLLAVVVWVTPCRKA